MNGDASRRKEEQVESYVIRIYRRHKRNPDKVAGVVEVIGKGGKKGFLGPDSLWAILTAPWGEPQPKRKPSGRGKRNAAMTLGEIMTRIAAGKR